jgi:hypothetical protein
MSILYTIDLHFFNNFYISEYFKNNIYKYCLQYLLEVNSEYKVLHIKKGGFYRINL